jgi:hypothetical protein
MKARRRRKDRRDTNLKLLIQHISNAAVTEETRPIQCISVPQNCNVVKFAQEYINSHRVLQYVTTEGYMAILQASKCTGLGGQIGE